MAKTHEPGTHDLGVHDLGGKDSFPDPVPHQQGQEVFHHDWEKRVAALAGSLLARATQNIAEWRHALERLDPNDYYQHGYYGRWMAGLELLGTEYGIITPEEIAAKLAEKTGATPEQAAKVGAFNRARKVNEIDASNLPEGPAEAEKDIPADSTKSYTVRRKTDQQPKFSAGDEVIARSLGTGGHTRVPGYAEAKRGTITEYHCSELLPDAHAHHLGERPQHVYAVGFDSAELWGDEAEAGVIVHVDMYECYLSYAD